MDSHKELKNILTKNKLVSSIDKIRSCGLHGFTDLHLTNLDTKLTNDSKYFISLNINNEPIILCYPNFSDLVEEIREKMIHNQYFGGYDKLKNRVLLHYENDGVFRIGNRSTHDKFTVNFEISDFHLLAKRNNYQYFINCLDNKEKHIAIQVLLCELGINLGFKVKFARNDSNRILLSKYSCDIKQENILTVPDLKLLNIKESQMHNNIDLIDVLWINPISKEIVVAFEVERSKNYDAVLRRFSYIENPNTYLVCVGDDYFNFKNSANNKIFYQWFKQKNLNYLNLNSLYSMLYENQKYGNALSFNSLLKSNLIKIS